MVHNLVVMEWVYKADQDFGFARASLFDNNLPYFDQICFSFQQAAEKYLKAYIVKFDLQFAKQHDLVKLLKICIAYNSALIELEDCCRYLNPFYFETRYADEVFAVCTKDQTEKAYKCAEKIQTKIREKLGVRKEITLEEIKKENKIVDQLLKQRKKNSI